MININPSVACIVLTWNSQDYIEKCLRSLLSSAIPLYILVVDNNSADSTREIVAQHFPDIELVNTGENLGYAGGNNFGIRRLLDRDFSHFFVLNPDAYVDPDCIATLATELSNRPTLAAASPMIYREQPNIIWYAGSLINWADGSTPHVGYNQADTGQFASVHETARLNGCAMLLSRAAIDKVGLMDDNYFLYYEETDWSVRFLEAGYQLGFVPTAKAWHEVSASTGGFHSPVYEYYMTRNKLYFLRKFRKRAQPFYSVRLGVHMAGNALLLYRTRGLNVARRALRFQLKGTLDHLRRRYGRQTLS